MEEFPTDLVVLMDELSPIEFLKLAYYKMGKMNIESMDELTELDKVMCKAADISTKLKLKMISPALRERFFKLVAEKGLDKPPSLLSGCANEHSLQKQTTSSQKASIPSTFFQNKKQPTLFQNTSRPDDVDPAQFQKSPGLFQTESGTGTQKPQDSEPFSKRSAASMWDAYEMNENFEGSVQNKQPSAQPKEPPTPRRQYREESDSPPLPAAYKSRSSSRPREDRSGRSSRRSRSPPSSYKSRGRSSSRPRMSESSRRSRSPPSSYSSSRSFSGFDSPQESGRDEGKDTKRDDGSSATTARKTGLSFSFAPRRKYPGGDKPPVKF